MDLGEIFEDINIFNYKNFSANKKRIVSNIFSLSTLEAANYILPLITLPYLVRVLGPGKYGLVAFAQAFIQYFILITDYGFNLSATRSISVNRDDPKRVSQIFSSVMFIKLMLMSLSLIVMLSLVFFIPKFRADWPIYLFAFGMVLGNVLFPVWFFQGMEKMKFTAFLNLTAKLIFVAAIFIFIRSRADYIYVPLLTSLGFLTAGAISMLIVRIRFKVSFAVPSLSEVARELNDGWRIFLSTISTNLYTTTNTFLLGIFTNNETVGYFSAGEKIVRALIRMFNPVFQAFYPHISKIASESKELAIQKLRKIFLFAAIGGSIMFLLMLIFSRSIVMLVLGSSFEQSIAIIRILSPLLVVIPIAYILANLVLLPFRLDKYFLNIYMSGAVISLLLLFTFLGVLHMGGIGTALANLITECILTFAIYVIIRKNGLKLFNLR